MNDKKPLTKSQRIRLISALVGSVIFIPLAIYAIQNPKSDVGKAVVRFSERERMNPLGDYRTSLQNQFDEKSAELDRITQEDPTQRKIDELLKGATNAYMDYFDNVVENKRRDQAPENYAKAKNLYQEVLILDPKNERAAGGLKLLESIKSLYDK